jgi:L-2,4-diaminobutyric acid acetyltransferase
MKAGDQTSPSDLRSNQAVRIENPVVDDGVDLWRMAKDSKVLDVNSRYAYLLWCRDFADTTVVARRGDDALGFVTGYRRPESPGTLFVWQVAVDEKARGLGLAGKMLDSLVDQVDEVDHLETTITPDNDASIALFTKFAKRWDAEVDRRALFDEELLGDDHLPENRFRIGPFRSRPQLRSVS